MNECILVVDDDREIVGAIAIVLEREGYTVRRAYDVLSPIRCKTLLDGGRRRTKNLYGIFKRTVPAGQVRQ